MANQEKSMGVKVVKLSMMEFLQRAGRREPVLLFLPRDSHKSKR